MQVKGLGSVSDIECITGYLLSLTMRLATSNASMQMSTSKLVDFRMILTDCSKSDFSSQVKISTAGIASIASSCSMDTGPSKSTPYESSTLVTSSDGVYRIWPRTQS